MISHPHAPSALAGLLVLLAIGCQETSDPQFTPVPPSSYRPGGSGPVGPRGDATVVGDPADAAETDADVGADGSAADAEVDAAPDAVLDAAPDAAEAAFMCNNDQDCVLAVRLPTCEPCPVAAHVDDVLTDRCLVVYIQGATIGTYTPADCWADCGDAIGEACFDAPAAAVCDPPRSVGQCALFR